MTLSSGRVVKGTATTNWRNFDDDDDDDGPEDAAPAVSWPEKKWDGGEGGEGAPTVDPEHIWLQMGDYADVMAENPGSAAKAAKAIRRVVGDMRSRRLRVV